MDHHVDEQLVVVLLGVLSQNQEPRQSHVARVVRRVDPGEHLLFSGDSVQLP